MKKSIYFLLWMLLLSVHGPMQASPQRKPIYFICMENTAAIKRHGFYPRLLGSLMAALQNEGKADEIDIQFVPFGSSQPIKVFSEYEKFAGYIKKKTEKVVNFERLAELVETFPPGTQVIIISRGEHQTSYAPLFSHLTPDEHQQMVTVTDRLKKKNLPFYALHHLENVTPAEEPGDIREYYRSVIKVASFSEATGDITGKNVIEELNYPSVTYDFQPFFKIHEGTLLFISAYTGHLYCMVDHESKKKQVKFYKGRRYHVYFVPEDLDMYTVSFVSKSINSVQDIVKALLIVNESKKNKNFRDWKECMQKFQEVYQLDTQPSSITNRIIKRDNLNFDLLTADILNSNGIILLLLNLEGITRNREYKKSLVALLDNIDNLYSGTWSWEIPFKSIYLLKLDIPGFSDRLRDRLLGHWSREKMEIVIQILSNPSNLRMLKYYLEGQLEKVSPQNIEYFRLLEE